MVVSSSSSSILIPLQCSGHGILHHTAQADVHARVRGTSDQPIKHELSNVQSRGLHELGLSLNSSQAAQSLISAAPRYKVINPM